MNDYKNYYRYILDNDIYNLDILIKGINEIFKEIMIDDNNQKNQKINNIEILKHYINEMIKSLVTKSKK